MKFNCSNHITHTSQSLHDTIYVHIPNNVSPIVKPRNLIWETSVITLLLQANIVSVDTLPLSPSVLPHSHYPRIIKTNIITIYI
jgi:hypothetical protein